MDLLEALETKDLEQALRPTPIRASRLPRAWRNDVEGAGGALGSWRRGVVCGTTVRHSFVSDAKSMRSPSLLALLLPLFVARGASAATPTLGEYASHAQDGRGWVVTTIDGQRLRITPYGDSVVRVQGASSASPFTPDDRYQMVLRHDGPGALTATDGAGSVTFGGAKMQVVVTKSPVRVDVRAGGASLLSETTVGGLATGDRPLRLEVNGATVLASMPYPITGGWTAWSTATAMVTLKAGPNAIRITSIGANGGNVDSLYIGGVTYEAENGARSGATAGNQNAGYTGTGYVDFQNAANDYVEFTVGVAQAGTFPIDIRYANGAAAAELFAPEPGEHFAGLGYGGFGRVASLDLHGQTITRNREYQAPILAPFYVSSRGYGVFVNSTWDNSFSFTDNAYGFSLAGGQVDYFVLLGPELGDVLDRYTALTGRPRLPPLAAFGLGLSDKLDDTLPSDEAWWKDKIQRMKDGKWPFDLVIHDNSWRNGKTAPWQWAPSRYSDPTEYESFCQSVGITNQLDFNRADDTLSAGWQPSFLMPGTTDYPDFSSPAVRQWFWNLLSTKSFDPALKYPGDFVWLDEPDDPVTPTGALADGRTWAEAGNYYFFQELQAVGEGWEATFQGKKRPYVMMRGATAGAQRWGTVWSGDIDDTYVEMKLQIRGMLAAGLSAFPFWAHDAGGFKTLPSDAMYRQWAVAMGSFSPMWKPHGIGLRFPWQFSQAAQDDMRAYGALRMQLLPYLYTAAWRAATTGLPIARAMIFDNRTVAEAWKADQEYMWGDALLVAPDTSDGGGTVNAWLPPGDWYDYWDETKHAGGTSLAVATKIGRLPIFAKAGGIVFGALPSLGTKAWDRAVRVLDVYAGADGRATQFEDDGVSDGYQSGNRALTQMTYTNAATRLELAADDGTYPGAPTARSYHVHLHGLTSAIALQVNGVSTNATWDAQKHVLSVDTPALPVNAKVVIEPLGGGGGDGGTGGDGGVGPGGGGAADAGAGATPGGSGSSSGCGCRAADLRGGDLAAASAFAIALAVARRRRRR